MALFQAGQTVEVAASRMAGTPAGRYKIICALPHSHGAVRYRVKGEKEAFERVIEEHVMTLQPI